LEELAEAGGCIALFLQDVGCTHDNEKEFYNVFLHYETIKIPLFLYLWANREDQTVVNKVSNPDICRTKVTLQPFYFYSCSVRCLGGCLNIWFVADLFV